MGRIEADIAVESLLNFICNICSTFTHSTSKLNHDQHFTGILLEEEQILQLEVRFTVGS